MKTSPVPDNVARTYALGVLNRIEEIRERLEDIANNTRVKRIDSLPERIQQHCNELDAMTRTCKVVRRLVPPTKKRLPEVMIWNNRVFPVET